MLLYRYSNKEDTMLTDRGVTRGSLYPISNFCVEEVGRYSARVTFRLCGKTFSEIVFVDAETQGVAVLEQISSLKRQKACLKKLGIDITRLQAQLADATRTYFFSRRTNENICKFIF